MIIRCPIAFLFGEGATQDASSLTIPIAASWTAEGVLVSLFKKLLSSRRLTLDDETGEQLDDETGEHLSGILFFNSIEHEKWKISLVNDTKIAQIFIGINETL